MTVGRVARLEYKFMENPWAERPAGRLNRPNGQIWEEGLPFRP